jgi:hypothetical protein
MKILLYGDMQVNCSRREYMRFLGLTVDYLVETIEKERPDLVINLGDTLDEFGKDDAESIVWAYDAMQRIGRATGTCDSHWVLLGNHDVQDREGKISAIETFRSDVTQVFMGPEVMANGVGVIPHWTTSYEDLYEILGDWASVKQLHTVVAHLDWFGFRLTPQYVSKDGLDFDRVLQILPDVQFFNGHYHTPQSMGQINFVGSPLWKDFSDYDSGTARGFYMWDTETKKGRRIVNPYTYQCLTVEVETEEDAERELSTLRPFDNLKVRVKCPSALFPLFEKYRSEFLWLGLYPTDTVKQEIETANITAVSAVEEVVGAALKEAPVELDTALLYKIGLEVYR